MSLLFQVTNQNCRFFYTKINTDNLVDDENSDYFRYCGMYLILLPLLPFSLEGTC